MKQKENVFIDDVEILGLNIKMLGQRNNNEDYDFTTLTLKHENREYILDTYQVKFDESNGDLEAKCFLEKDEELFPDCKYDLKGYDLFDKDKLYATLFVDGGFPNIIESITLFVKNNGCTIAINVNQE